MQYGDDIVKRLKSQQEQVLEIIEGYKAGVKTLQEDSAKNMERAIERKDAEINDLKLKLTEYEAAIKNLKEDLTNIDSVVAGFNATLKGTTVSAPAQEKKTAAKVLA
jgi:predicted RNase H-like nuclease (RuvC/YqgF family)